MRQSPVILWFRRDLRLSDHQSLAAALETGRPVIPVFIHDELVERLGAAPKWRLGLSVSHFADKLDALGARLILRRGNALEQLQKLVVETGASHVFWSRAYDPDAIARDKEVKAGLKEEGVTAESFAGHLLFEPWEVSTKTGGYFRVYTPMWRAVRDREIGQPLSSLTALPTPEYWPESEKLDDWQMGASMNRGADIVLPYQAVGEDAARDRLDQFIARKIATYKEDRDYMPLDASSRLSENLTYGEISPRTIWWAGWDAFQKGRAGAEHFLKELVWREFAYHLAFHTPHITTRNWREEWDSFPWQTHEALRWKQGRTGIQLVDAAMREMYVTGTMHNRGRMIVASYLTKHMMTHWKVGMDWFAECLTDWDPASNAMGWQWSAGSGPDATPYFRVFNADTQAEKFDKAAEYRSRFLAEAYLDYGKEAELFYRAIPRSWNLTSSDPYPEPLVTLADGRAKALEAYAARKSSG